MIHCLEGSLFFDAELTQSQLLTRRLTLVVLLGLWGCLGCSSSPPEEPVAVAQRLASVQTARLGEFPAAVATRSFSGIVQPRRNSVLAAKELGRIEEVAVDTGADVVRGQLLIQLDSEQLKAEHAVAAASLASAQERLNELQAGPRSQELRQAESRLAEVRANLKLAIANRARILSLLERRAASQQQFDEAESALQSLQAQEKTAGEQLDLLREGTRKEQIAAQLNQVASLKATLRQLDVRLSEKEVRAPYDGSIQRRMVDEGDVVSPGQVLLEIVEVHAKEIQVGLPSELVGTLEGESLDRVASSIRMTRSGNSGPAQLAVKFSLERVAPTIDPVSRTRRCIFRVEEGAELLELGDSVNLQFRETENRGPDPESFSPWVPTESLVAGARGLSNLFVLDRVEDQFTIVERPVHVLRIAKDWAQVQGCVEEGQLFVTEGTHLVVPGQAVSIKNSTSTEVVMFGSGTMTVKGQP